MIDRRTFLRSAATLTVCGASAKSYARIVGSNSKLRLAVIGLNGRGKDHMAGLRPHVVAVCDCDRKILEEQSGAHGLAAYVDFRELLLEPDIDGVTIATPNHSHAQIAIAALLAGKHVYVEKPVSHNVWEGRQLVNAAQRSGLICQAGTQSRSSPSLQAAVAYARSGVLGKALYAIGTCFKPRRSIGRLDAPLTIPSHIDYDLWCGPADKVPLYRPQLHYDWHWDFNTGNGDMGNQGIHQMDIARWFLGYDRLSPRVWSVGGRLGYSDAGNTPNTQTVLHDYGDAPIVFETRGLPAALEFQSNPRDWDRNMDSFRDSRVGVLVQYEHGHVLIPNYTSAVAYDEDGKQIEVWSGGGDHYANFVDAIQNNDADALHGPVLEGHLSSALCHTGNISHQTGRLADTQEIRNAVSGHALFAESVDRMLRHLEANGIHLAEHPTLTLGADLTMDALREEFTDHAAANRLLKRRGRAEFPIPEIAAEPMATERK